jgi:hypothetical protein
MSNSNQSSQKEKVDEAKGYHYSSNISPTEHVVLAHRVYQQNYRDCLDDDFYNDGLQDQRCACRLGISGDEEEIKFCYKGFNDAKNQFKDKDSPSNNPHTYDQLKWCFNNMPTDTNGKQQESWVIGCVNYLRK